MLRIVRALALVGFAALLVLAPGAAASPATGGLPRGLEPFPVSEPGYVPGELLVRFKPGVAAAGRSATLRSVGARVEQPLLVPGLQLVGLPRGASVRAAAAVLERDSRVLRATPNYVRELDALPGDPLFSRLWALHSATDHDIDAPEAWSRTTGSDRVVVSVVDSGVAHAHPDLAPNIWTNRGEIPGNGVDDDGNHLVDDVRGFDFVDFDHTPLDLNGHGTHVAGTIGARGKNGIGVTGVNWRVKIMPVRAANAVGELTDVAIVNSLFYSASMGADVVNGSFGGAAFSQDILDVINLFPDVLFVFAAGNLGRDNDTSPTYPCSYPAPNIVCVGASDESDRLSGFSNHGETNVDLASPGTSILSAWPAYDDLSRDLFEDGSLGPEWAVGTTAGRSWAATSEAKRSGSFSAADSPGALYEDNTDSWIETVSPTSLAGRFGCALDYALRLDSEPGFDGLLIEVSTDGGSSWKVVSGWSGSTGGAFLPFLEDLSVYDGAASLLLRFRFVSDGSTVADGAHLDDVAVKCLTSAFGVDDYAELSGTSMAAPHVTGVAALVLAANPRLSAAAVKRILLNTVDAVPGLAGLVATGGRVNANRAVLAALPRVRIGDASVREGDRGTKSLRFTVRLSAASGNPVAVSFKTVNGSARAPDDYGGRSGKVTFLPGRLVKTITVPVKGDRRDERNETFFVRLTKPVNAILADRSGRALIRDND
jgi:subtilisin family serine protease